MIVYLVRFNIVDLLIPTTFYPTLEQTYFHPNSSNVYTFFSISKTFSFRQFSDDKQSTHTHTQGLH